MMIRQAQLQDLRAIGKVHSICFPNSLMTKMNNIQTLIGEDILLEFYRYYLNDAPELFYVACDNNNKIVGFCMGYYMDQSTQMQRFLKQYKTKICIVSLLLMIKGDKHVWNKVLWQIKHRLNGSDWKIVNNKYEHITDNKRGDLLSVCVLPDYRGQGYAQQLMDSFILALKHNERELCLLSVETKNKRAIKYYERNGFELYRTRNSDGLTYIKLL